MEEAIGLNKARAITLTCATLLAGVKLVTLVTQSPHEDVAESTFATLALIVTSVAIRFTEIPTPRKLILGITSGVFYFTTVHMGEPVSIPNLPHSQPTPTFQSAVMK